MIEVFNNKLLIPGRDNLSVMVIKDIIYCKAEGSYTWIYLNKSKSFLAAWRLNIIQSFLDDYGFIRCHRSFLVNIKYIKTLCPRRKRYLILDDNTIINVSCCRHPQLRIQLLNSISSEVLSK